MSNNLDIELMQTLLAIADTGSFSAAAQAVHRTQSAVSMQMKRLEEIVGQPLFEKQGRKAVLTMQGQNLLLYARRMLALQEEAIATFRSPEIKGEVRLGVCDDYVLSHMPPILASYAQQYPQVHISLDCQTSMRLISAVSRSDLDLALVNVVKPDLEYEKLTREHLVWVTSSRHLIHEADPLPLAVEGNCLWGIWAQQAMDLTERRYRLAYTTFNISGVTAIVEAGLAVSVMSRNSVPPGLRILGVADGFPELPTASIGLVLRSSKLSPAVQYLADAIRHSMTAEAPLAA